MAKLTGNARLPLVWLVLASLTLFYLWVDHTVDRGGPLRPSTAVTVTAIVVALVKVRLIAGQFMEVRHAPGLLRRLADLWVVLIGTGLLVSYFAGAALA